MKLISFIQPNSTPNIQFSLVGIFSLLIISIFALLFAPYLMPASYSWLAHTTSESAAQGIQGAWLARLGFVAYGLAILWLCSARRYTWGKGALIFHACFGALMISAAAFSSRPWIEAMTFDPIEDFLHSFTSTALGFAFCFGIMVVLFQRNKTEYSVKAFDILAIAVATFMSLGIAIWPEAAGLIQRIMFCVAYSWYAMETLRLRAVVKAAHTT